MEKSAISDTARAIFYLPKEQTRLEVTVRRDVYAQQHP
jgi:hypothetical protein